MENQTPQSTPFSQKIKSFLEEVPKRAVLHRAFRIWRHKEFVSEINHEEVMVDVVEDGRMTSRYSFMVTMSCAIAILGLLLSSPAVIIGAMLISPLMGPIMSLGFSLCILDLKQMKKALEAILIGFLLSIAISFFVVFISPISDPTPEIMARTQPNLFDLLVAVFSGLAGGYATIKRKGATIVGVAIATALMPPLAVVGYGISTESWKIAQGAFFLFMTNLLAISLSVTALAKWYGFGTHNSPKHTVLQTGIIVIAFILLSIPLGLSLMNIAHQTYVTKTAKAEINKHFENAHSRISNFSIAFSKSGEVTLDCLVVTDQYSPAAETQVKNSLENSISRPVNISLDQIVVAKDEQEKIEVVEEPIIDSALTNPMQAKLSLLGVQEEMAQAIKNSVFFPLKFVKVDVENDTVSIYPKAAKGINLPVLHSVEEKLRSRFPDWSIFVVPPVRALPFIYFEIGRDETSGLETDKISDIAWALQRWDVQDVSVVGFASSVGDYQRFDNNSLAARRANFVADALEERGFAVDTRGEYTSFAQQRDERNFGINSFHRVEVRFTRDADLPEPLSEDELLQPEDGNASLEPTEEAEAPITADEQSLEQAPNEMLEQSSTAAETSEGDPDANIEDAPETETLLPSEESAEEPPAQPQEETESAN